MYKTVRDIDVNRKLVLVRADLNVPLQDGHISDDTRIRASLPTLQYLLDKEASILICSHHGHPNGLHRRRCLSRVFREKRASRNRRAEGGLSRSKRMSCLLPAHAAEENKRKSKFYAGEGYAIRQPETAPGISPACIT